MKKKWLSYLIIYAWLNKILSHVNNQLSDVINNYSIQTIASVSGREINKRIFFPLLETIRWEDFQYVSIQCSRHKICIWSTVWSLSFRFCSNRKWPPIKQSVHIYRDQWLHAGLPLDRHIGIKTSTLWPDRICMTGHTIFLCQVEK
jgi:hypothetical protein